MDHKIYVLILHSIYANLYSMRMRRKPNLAARTERCSHIVIPEPELYRGRWLDEFGFSGLHVEIGCGKGRFTIDAAKSEPEALLVALEKSDNVMVIALERTVAEDLQNVRFINEFADYLIDYFAPGEVSRIYINFCDPWPSNRHVKRRLTHHRFLDLYKNILIPKGELRFKTDNLPLFEFSLREFGQCGFELLEVTYDLHKNGPVGILTDYEQKFIEQGKPIYQCIARL